MLAGLQGLMEEAEDAAHKEPGKCELHLRAMEMLSHWQGHCQSRTGGQPDGEQLCGEGPGCPDGRQVNHDPAVWPGWEDGEWHPGVH